MLETLVVGIKCVSSPSQLLFVTASEPMLAFSCSPTTRTTQSSRYSHTLQRRLAYQPCALRCCTLFTMATNPLLNLRLCLDTFNLFLVKPGRSWNLCIF